LACGNKALTYLRDRGQLVTGEVVVVHTERHDDTVVMRFRDIRRNEVTAQVGSYRWSRSRDLATAPNSCTTPATRWATLLTSAWDRLPLRLGLHVWCSVGVGPGRTDLDWSSRLEQAALTRASSCAER
jgi:hypothetical protein